MKKLSRACSPSLPTSMPAVELLLDRCFGRVRHGVPELGRIDRLAAAPAAVQVGEFGRAWQTAGVSGEYPRLARQHRAILAAVLMAMATLVGAPPAGAASESPATAPVVMAPAPQPVTPTPKARDDVWDAAKVLRTILIGLVFAVILGSLFVKRRAVRIALRNAPPVSDE